MCIIIGTNKVKIAKRNYNEVQRMLIDKHFENPNILHVHTEPDRAYYIPYFSVNAAVIKEVLQ